MKKEFKFEVSTREIQTVEDIMNIANISVSDSMKSYLLGLIFAKKMSSIMEGVSWQGDVLKVVRNILINISGIVKRKRKDSVTGEIIREKVSESEEVEVTMIPLQFEGFKLNGCFVTFTMKVNEQEWKKSTLIERVRDNGMEDKRYRIDYPEKDIKSEEYWENIFNGLESRLSVKANRNTLMVWTFNVLKQKRMHPLCGRDVIEVRKMYYHCMDNFPIFANLPFKLRLEYFNEAVDNVRKVSSADYLGPDIIAKYILEVLMDKKVHYMYGNCKIDRTYYKGVSTKIDSIRYISYIKPNGRHTSYSPFSIWHEMARSYEEESVSDDS